MAEQADWHCYRHPERESGVRCRRCERPICPACMITAPVGFQCPECVRRAPAVRPLRSLPREPNVTKALVGLNVLVAVLAIFDAGTGGGVTRSVNSLARDFALSAGPVADGEWWRLVTSGFLHYGLVHLGLNMFVLWRLGSILEPAIGGIRFAALYAAALLGGSFGALLLSPDALTAGASGAVYGVMGALVIIEHRRGGDIMRSGLGGLLLANLLFTFLIPGISIGGHLGGLVAGTLAGALVERTEGNDLARRMLGVAGCAVVALAATAGAIAVAGGLG